MDLLIEFVNCNDKISKAVTSYLDTPENNFAPRWCCHQVICVASTRRRLKLSSTTYIRRRQRELTLIFETTHSTSGIYDFRYARCTSWFSPLWSRLHARLILPSAISHKTAFPSPPQSIILPPFTKRAVVRWPREWEGKVAMLICVCTAIKLSSWLEFRVM